MKNIFREKKRTHITISVILTISLILSSVFLYSGLTPVSAEENKPTSTEIEKMESLTLDPQPGTEYDGYIVKIADGKEDKVDEDSVEKYESAFDNEFIMVDEPTDALDFVDTKYVDYVEPNYERYPTDYSDTKKYFSISEGTSALSIQPSSISLNDAAYKRINVSELWAAGYNGSGVNIAILDTGLNSHVGLDKSKVKKTYNFFGKYKSGYWGSGNDSVADDYRSAYGHGTFVAGLIASKSISNSTYTFQGVANNSNLYIGKIMNALGGTVGDFLIALDTLYVRNDDIDILNMSFGGTGYSNIEYNAIYRMTKKGTIAIAAAGNEGQKGSPYNYPANYPNVIGVGSTDDSGTVSYFSSKNSSVLIAAPGNALYSTASGDYYGLYNLSGTSFSAPLVTGAIAMLRQIDDNISQSQILTLIKTTSNDKSKNNKKSYDINLGYGILDVKEMVDKVKSGNISNSYQISYRAEGCSLSGTPPTIHTTGTTTVIPKTIKKIGYNFSHWVDQKGIKRASIAPNYSGDDLLLTPKWTPKKYKLKFKGNGGKTKVSSKSVTYSKAVGTLKTPKKRSGYNFLGWFTKKSGGTQYYKGKKYKTAGNLTLYAHWTKKKVVKFNANKGTVKKYAKAITKGKKYGSLPKPTRSGYTFKGWYTKKSGGKKVTKNSKVTKSGNVTLYAHWKKK